MEVYRGDIFYIMKPQQYQTTGSEQEPGRPAIIVSNDTGNHFSECVEVVYLTTQDKKPLPTHVEVMCHVPSTALCEQIFSLSKERLGNYIRSCTDEEMAAIDEALMISLGIEREHKPFTEAEVENDQLRRELNDCVNVIENQNAELDGLRNLLTEKEQTIETLKQSDKVVLVSDNKDDIMRLEVERDFYKSQYESLFERVVGKAVQP